MHSKNLGTSPVAQKKKKFKDPISPINEVIIKKYQTKLNLNIDGQNMSPNEQAFNKNYLEHYE